MSHHIISFLLTVVLPIIFGFLLGRADKRNEELELGFLVIKWMIIINLILLICAIVSYFLGI